MQRPQPTTLSEQLDTSSTESTSFTYEPLLKDQIRLLRRCHSVKSLQYELIHVDIEEAQRLQYLALSYAWGEDTPSHVIPLTGGKILLSRDNLNKVLKSPFFLQTENLVWIDAICINQEDMAEKSVQIAHIRKIYSNAEKVIAWVGESDKDSDLSIDVLVDLEKCFRVLDQMVLAGLPASITDKFREIHPMSQPDWDLSYLGRFMGRSWFERVWIIQEVVMGREVEIMCGSRTLDWNTFSYVINWLVKYNLTITLLDTALKSFASGLHTCVSLITWRYESLAASTESRSLDSLLQSSGLFKASDPRDKIYALLGICDGISDEGIVVDYRCSVEHVYTEVARQLLSRAKNFALLASAGVGFARTYNDMPSWVPDWTSIADEFFMNSAFSASYHATAEGSPQIKAMSDPSSLTIGGVYIDQITAVHELPPVNHVQLNDEEGADAARSLEREFDKSSQKFSLDTNPTLPLCEREEIHWRTLCGNLDDRGHPMPAKYAQYYECLVTERERFEETPANLTQEDQEQMEILWNGAVMYTKAWFVLDKRRRLCRTALGFLGLAPPNAKAGDLVCLFLGANTPFLLRKHDLTFDGDQTYLLVGECYVHGLMNMEGMEMGVEQDFILR